MKSGYRLSRLARQDFRNIGRHTQREWGLEQRDIYLRRINEAMERIAENPGLGIGREDVLPGLRSIMTGRHQVFYRATEPSGIFVLRLLHQRMDPSRHLVDTSS